MDVGIVGGSGYGGAELVRLLAGHPALKLRTLGARSHAGADVATVFPHLPDDLGAFAPAAPEAFEGCDLVFLATPHEASLELAPALLALGAAVVDLSGAFRLGAGAFETAYGLEHTAPDLAPAPYGLPELFREELRGARLVANPGCYPTAALLAMAPLAGIVDPATVTVSGMSGASGAGKSLRDDLNISHAAANVAPYGAPGHRHAPEIAAGWRRLLAGEGPTGSEGPNPRGAGKAQHLSSAAQSTSAEAAPTFVPHLVPMSRGLVCTVVARLTDEVTADELGETTRTRYADEPFVRVLAQGTWPHTTHVIGGNMAHLGVVVDPAAGTAVAACAIDNLVKGAAGQAIQNANLVLGLPEGTGLPRAGLYP